jgi:hypothetical protein
VTVAGHEVISGVAQSSGDDAGEGCQAQHAAKVVSGQEGGIRTCCDPFGSVTAIRAKPDHGVDRVELGVQPAKLEAVHPVEGGKAKRALLVMAEYRLHGGTAEPAFVIEKEDGV